MSADKNIKEEIYSHRLVQCFCIVYLFFEDKNVSETLMSPDFFQMLFLLWAFVKTSRITPDSLSKKSLKIFETPQQNPGAYLENFQSSYQE